MEGTYSIRLLERLEQECDPALEVDWEFRVRTLAEADLYHSQHGRCISQRLEVVEGLEEFEVTSRSSFVGQPPFAPAGEVLDAFQPFLPCIARVSVAVAMPMSDDRLNDAIERGEAVVLLNWNDLNHDCLDTTIPSMGTQCQDVYRAEFQKEME